MSEDQEGGSTGLIIGIIAGGVVVLCLAALGVYWVLFGF